MKRTTMNEYGVVEKLYCMLCRERSEVVREKGMYILLKCGHVTVKEGSSELEKSDRRMGI